MNAVVIVIIQFLNHPRENYLKGVRELQEARIDGLSQALAPALVHLGERWEDETSDLSSDDISSKDSAAFQLTQALKELDDMSEIRDHSQAIDEPRQRYRDCWQYRDKCWKLLLFSLLISLVVIATLFTVEQTLVVAIYEAMAFAFAIALFAYGMYAFHKSRQARIWLDEHIESTDFL